ncbi:MAG TPA: hypothetical protein VFO29_07495 [Candidatus Rubrimentiphilum sp.]|nr:hypothetical protein [Candidatus Rubrimentiphilum sp.]
MGARFTTGAQRLQPIEMITMRSSAIRLERRPQPQRPQIQPPAPQPLPRPVPKPQPPKPQQPQRQPPPHRELARINPRASITAPKAAARHAQSFSEQLAQQQVQYQQTIARLRRENNPVISAAQPVSTPAATKRYAYDFSGSIGSPNIGEGILYPLQMWQVGPYDYYYVRYWVVYPDGTSETGVVPWPLRYLPAQDPFKLGIRYFPLPGPMPDYVLPAGTNLHPLVAYCYAHRFQYCPPEHG